jgi:hypothetical protein
MKIIPPITITPALLTSTNVAITETAWTAGTYTTGTRRYVGTDLYEVLASPSTAQSPADGVLANPPTWILVGKINRFKMFDFRIGDATTNSGTIEVEISPGQIVNAIAAFEVYARTVYVTITDPIDGVVYSKTIKLLDNSEVLDWYSYFFSPIRRETEFILTDLPSYSTAVLSVTFDAEGAEARVGEFVAGAQRTLGVSLIDVSIGIEDFSRKERDEFGNILVVERRFAKTMDLGVFFENNRVSQSLQILAENRAKPAVYIADEGKLETLIFGFYRNFSVLRTGPITSEMSIEIEGII